MIGADEAGAGPTVGSVRRDLAQRLRAGWGGEGDGTAALDARLLLAHALGVDPGDLARRDGEPVPDPVFVAAAAMVERRRAGEPVARIVGEKEFWSLPFRLAPATMVPRPDTETVVSSVLEVLAAQGRLGDSLELLDLGTGSGCILLALLSELPEALGIGIDRSPEAAAMAAENARRLGISSRARFVAGDWARPLAGRYDAILANPPYVEDEALPALPAAVIGYDPRLALSGGTDGISAYRAIIPELPRLLAPAGLAALEFGPRQSGPIREIAGAVGLAADIRRDLAGRERVALLTLS
jgi:release factor glutamine methyltransferase